MATTQSHGRLSISGLGWSLSATLVVLFVLCMVAALFVPLRLAHGWISVWSDAPIELVARMDRRPGLERRGRMAGRADFWHNLQQHRCAPRVARCRVMSQMRDS